MKLLTFSALYAIMLVVLFGRVGGIAVMKQHI